MGKLWASFTFLFSCIMF
uniref:V-type proton ATPase subunit B 1 n=1 Tax=Rhizophora mucronata TaxID=61149 RepID=A0A2P2MTZ2_RHIMU